MLRLSAALTVTVATLALGAAPALAKGGVKAPPVPPSDPAVSWSLCSEYLDPAFGRLPDGSTTFANVLGGGGCVIVRAWPTGALTLHALHVVPGWIGTVNSPGGGTSNRVDVEVFNPQTGELRQATIEPGRTRIR